MEGCFHRMVWEDFLQKVSPVRERARRGRLGRAIAGGIPATVSAEAGS